MTFKWNRPAVIVSDCADVTQVQPLLLVASDCTALRGSSLAVGGLNDATCLLVQCNSKHDWSVESHCSNSGDSNNKETQIIKSLMLVKATLSFLMLVPSTFFLFYLPCSRD